MPASFAFTLYEIFGYLLPGAIAESALIFFYWAVFAHRAAFVIPSSQPTVITWIVLVAGAYLLGHGVQSISNKLLRSFEVSALAKVAASPLGTVARQICAEMLRMPVDQITPHLLCRTVDEYALQAGQSGDREIFIYREGFYRGCSIALFSLALAMLLRCLIPGTAIGIHGAKISLSIWPVLFSTGFISLLGWLFLRRYQRFVDYRLSRAILAALVIQGNAIRKE